MENLILHISSGQGPEECCRAVFHVSNFLKKYLDSHSIYMTELSTIKSQEKNCFQSMTYTIKGDNLHQILADWVETIQWIAISPFRPKHKRKNWFVSVSLFPTIEIQDWKTSDFVYETCRSSGPGGQNVNKVESAVRVTHTPTKIAVQVSEKRTQLENKKIATERLLSKLRQLNEAQLLQFQIDQWTKNKELERGNPVKIFNEPL